MVASGVGLVGAGASALQTGHGTQNDLVLVKVGISMLTATWVMLCVWTGISFLPSQHVRTAAVYGDGTKASNLYKDPDIDRMAQLTHIPTRSSFPSSLRCRSLASASCIRWSRSLRGMLT